jgi:exosortase D (VPLPA-CTERM-specific)
MLMKTDKIGASKLAEPRTLLITVAIAASLVVLFFGFSKSILELVRRWSVEEEYSHGFLIPPIAAWLLWSRREAIVASLGRPSWIGPVLILVALAMHVVGELSALFILSQGAFILSLFGIALGLGGFPLLRVVFIPIVFLIFAIPMPYFIDAMLTWRLQLVSSELGTFFIRLLGIPVYLEGNVIDLGVYKLQVVEACSGLRYMYPLLSLSFLAAYLFQAPLWQRAVVFLSAVPITILMNSLRIGLVGVMVNYFGPQDADGFLHMFEGWIIFMACALVLAAEVAIFARFSGKSFSEVFYPPKIVPSEIPAASRATFGHAPVFACLALLCAVAVTGSFVSSRQEIRPDRNSFASFPTVIAGWQGRASTLDKNTERYLGVTDYLLSDYADAGGRQVNLYVAYYASQRSGFAPHSPSVCIPGNGWQIARFERSHYTSANGNISLPLNRVLISRGQEKQLVYYWFEGRGQQIANEYVSKLYLLRDAILKNRTDGALVRVTTPIFPTESESDADKRLQAFIQISFPQLTGFLPAAPGAKIKPAMTPLSNGRPS